MKPSHGKLGDAAKKIGGTLVSPPLQLSDVEQYFGHEKQFPDIARLMSIVEHEVLAETQDFSTNLTRALEYGNHSSANEHMYR